MFTVKVRARTIASDWSEPVMMQFERTPPYWTTRWFSVTVTIVSLIFIICVIIITRRLVLKAVENRHKQVELELKSIYAQLNPHFIFNSLNAAMYLVKTKQMDEAYQHIYKFSALLRAYIKSSRNRVIKLGAEIDNLRNYVELQQARFNNKFVYDINIGSDVDLSYNIPSLILQPLVENAIIHGLLHKDGVGKLTIGFVYDDQAKELICIVDDNGVGRDAAKPQTEDHAIKEESYGGDLIKDLITVFNRSGNIKIGIAYVDKQPPETGTIVKLKIKELK
jgi:LytS/YehU family sensor histidine kinase